MTTRDQMKDRILRVITAILQPEGFTTQWYSSGRRSFEMRETFCFDASERLKAITGDDQSLVHKVSIRRVDTTQETGAMPEPCDWCIDDIVNWIQDLEEVDVADLPAADMELAPVRLMSRILDTADKYNDSPAPTPVRVGRVEWAAGYASDANAARPIILCMVHGPVDNKWGAEEFLSQ